jgi:hypothetical protein
MEKLDNKHAKMFGKMMQDTGIINVNSDEYTELGHMTERLYLYVQGEQQRDMREQVNKQQSSGG